jgi:SWI/SNF-related matrix-associated actin-dependent regulator 1 of chromatin subfamily A
VLPLRPYQQRAIDDLLSGKANYLAAEPGLGKTRMALEYAKAIGATNILYFCPATVKISTRYQVNTWWPEAKTHMPSKHEHVGAFKTRHPLVTIINPDKISRGSIFTKAIVDNAPYDLLVIDEAHQYKNIEAHRTRALYREIAKVCKKVLPMSGTPMTAGPQDLYVPLRYLAPEKLLNKAGATMNRMAFEDRYCQVEMKRLGGRLVRVVRGARNTEELKQRLGDFFIRLTKKECLPELPPLQFVGEPILLSERSVELDAVADGLKGLNDEEVIAHLNAMDEHLMSLLAKLGAAKATAAVKYLQEFLEDNPHEKIVVWAKHRETIDRTMEGLKEFKPQRIDGRDNDKAREKAIDTFLTDPAARLFVGQIHAAGTGITLLNADVQPSNVFFIEQTFDFTASEQAACRCHRLGQQNAVLARVFYAENVPLDEMVQNILIRKQAIIKELLND